MDAREEELINCLDALLRRVMVDQGHSPHLCSKREMTIIETLGKHGLQTMTEVADNAMLSLSTATGIVDNLVAKSLASRERSEEDRRVVQVELTPEGLKLYRESQEFRLKLVREILTSLKGAEQAAFMNLFRKIAQGIRTD